MSNSDEGDPDHYSDNLGDDQLDGKEYGDEDDDENFLNDDKSEGDEDDSEFNLSPDHELFKKLNDDLKQQFSAQRDAIEVEIRDQIALKNKLSESREQTGVELYTVQQQLAKLNNKLLEVNEQTQVSQDERTQMEAELQELRKRLDESIAELDSRNKDYEKQRDELDKLNEIVLRLEEHNQEVANEKAVVHRKTYKSEQSATEAEQAKQEQDLYIDRLTQQMQDITQKLAVVESQISAQIVEKKTARDALLQASLEMDKINFQRNHLTKEWNSALIDVKKRTETLAQLQASSAKQDEEIRSLQNQENGLKEQIKDQQEISEKNTLLKNKIIARIQNLNQKIEQVNAERNKQKQELTELNQDIRTKEEEVSRLIIKKNAANSDFKLSMKGTNEIANQIKEIEDKIIKHVTDQSNLKRDVGSIQNTVEQIREQITIKDRELSGLQNETVRLRIDKLNITGRSEKLQRGLDEIIKELKQREDLISQYESQISKNDVTIEKRQSEVDKLNRQYDALTSAQNGEEYGPLERKIRAIESRIAQSDAASAESQAQWLKKQTELVMLTHSCEEIEEQNNNQQAHISVLSRKRDRTRLQVQQTEKEIEKLKIQIKLLQREMGRLGEQLSNSVGNGNQLVEGNINFEAEILETMKKKEEESAKLEMQIEEVANSREELAEKLMEEEKQIMQWEKKLQLAKEMQDALDPNYGAPEVKAMKKEISKMEHRLKQIKKQQQNVLQNMEYGLRRRPIIANRVSVQQSLNKDKIRADIVQGITELKREAKRLTEETKKFEASMQRDVQAQRELAKEIEEDALITHETQIKKQEIEESIKKAETSKVQQSNRLQKLQAKVGFFSNSKTILKSVDGFEQAFSNSKWQQDQLIQAIDHLSQDFPHLKDHLQEIKDKMSIV